jgi:hypothetical protein
MKLSTVIVGLLLAFLLFTPQGHFVAQAVMLRGIQASQPAPDPTRVAAEDPMDACYNSRMKASYERAEKWDRDNPALKGVFIVTSRDMSDNWKLCMGH